MFVLVGTMKLQVDVLKMPSLGGSGPVCPWILRSPLDSKHVKIHSLHTTCITKSLIESDSGMLRNKS